MTTTNTIINDERFENLMPEFRSFRDKEINFYNEDGSWEIKMVEKAEAIPDKDNAYTVICAVSMSKKYSEVAIKRNMVVTGNFYLDKGQIMDLRKSIITIEVS